MMKPAAYAQTSQDAPYGLLGRSLKHSFSPEIHRRLGSFPYALHELEPGQLEEFVLHGSWKGLNVTIPYKETVMPLCDSLSPAASSIGCVNTLTKNSQGQIIGDNTDYYGFKYLVEDSGFDFRNAKVAVLGDGGAAKTVRAVSTALQAREIVTVSRKGPITYDCPDAFSDADYFINTTPVGMYPHCPDSVIDLAELSCVEGFALKGVIDIVYNPLRTRIMAQAESLRIPCVNGLKMLVAQAKRASELFQETVIDDSRLKQIHSDLTADMTNIVLIGMPGSGKSTVGREVAKILHRPYVDLDLTVSQLAGRSIPQIFLDEGEDGFRRLETQAVFQESKRTGIVISCGGGVVTRQENLELLRQNSFIVQLVRPIDQLQTNGRPLTQAHGVQALYEARKGLYRQWADASVANAGTVDEAVRSVMAGFKASLFNV